MCLIAFLPHLDIQYHDLSTKLLIQNPAVEPMRHIYILSPYCEA
ncbi:hypothetical protein FOXB_13205 [Fusarium oxysporum f. sp. conglutinans Fo5176]|uniref:Uncharacterized protein n=1 Tax=Fusarium oxysporum (strain Fo5176) TaxID=660025 RepID=F9G3H3_FUSOF|nr:hypothetical protein FOXB_13205 [Fusarium oxysporum f. sp. conglutinans Fo5176]